MLPGNNCYADIKSRKGDKCAICGKETTVTDNMVVEKKTIHKECFKCGVCQVKLVIGHCARDHSLARFGPIWFCDNHSLMPPGEKAQYVEKLRNKVL
ncbi:LIM domain-containing protein [Aphelenchoides avenae]|nr:LIM domain-containing protein [Aphelenchus avenae]